MHLNQQDPFYKRYCRKKSSGVIWGHRGQTYLIKFDQTLVFFFIWACLKFNGNQILSYYDYSFLSYVDTRA